MRVTLGVDALSPALSGIGRYSWELWKGLSRHPEVSDLQAYRQNRLVADPEHLLVGDRPPHASRTIRRLQFWHMRRRLRSSLVHGPNYFLPPATEQGVITVHDLSVLLYPETHPADRIRAFEAAFLPSLDQASHIITDSETVRTELVEQLSVSRERITAIHLGVDSRFSPDIDQDTLYTLKAFGLAAGSYGLCVSTLEPRKKIVELIEAWERLPSALREQSPLVLVGGGGWRNEGIKEAIARGRAAGWLHYLGFVPDQQLPALYRAAKLFVYPSVYEGFGLPPLEALASGVPVIVAGRSCLPEVCGSAARFIDPDDGDAFTAAVSGALSDTDWQGEAIRLGLARAAEFSWDRCVAQTVAVYHQLLAGPSQREAQGGFAVGKRALFR